MPQVTRRTFLKGATVTLGAAGALQAEGAKAQGDVPAVKRGERLAIELKVNGEGKKLEVLPDETLAHALRERLKMTGTKTSCEGGACGACTVIVDGRPTHSCLTLALDAEGVDVRTVEGLAERTEEALNLHPVQQAFLEADSLQCGFCTPGFVMAGVAFYDRWVAAHGNARPPRDDVIEALSGNICRCGTQPHLVEAVQAACEGVPARPPGGARPPWVLPRVDGVEKVTGAATYAIDVLPEGMLHAFVLRSPHAHARVTRLDTTKAESMPGVVAVEVALPRVPGKVRFGGQEVVAVAAETLEQARAAAAAVEVDYEVLPHVLSWQEAERGGAPAVWENHDEAPVASEGANFVPGALVKWEGNVRGPAYWPLHRDNEDAREVAVRAPVSTSVRAETSSQAHVTLERHVAVASWEGDELTLHTSTQYVQGVQGDLADALGVPRAKVRVLSPYVGGGFGSKGTIRPEQLIAARLARKAGRPVRVLLPLKDHLVIGGNRPATYQTVSIGANEKGRMQAIAQDARSMCGVGVGEKASGLTDVHYDVAEKHIRDVNVITNTAPSCPFRAPGFPANAFALEQAVDDIAVKAERDPLELRIEQEERRRTRLLYRAALERCGYGPDRLKAVAPDRGRFVRGVGVATGEWFVLASPSARVELKAFRDGHVEVSTATHDMGQGARSVLANVVADILRLPAERITVKVGDSSLPRSMGSFGSITTPSVAPAAMKAAQKLRRVLARSASRKVERARAEERGVRGGDGQLVPWADLFDTLPEDPFVAVAQRGKDKDGYALPPKLFDPLVGYSPFAIAKDQPASVHVTEVEVDRHLGRVRPLRTFVALDAGRVVSPITAHSQVVGAVMMGTSYALYEGVRWDPLSGLQLNRSLETYGLLGVADAPEVDVHFYDAASEHNPYGSIGLGENSIVPAAAAVANAVFRATGRRVPSTPMTPAKVLKALG